LYAEHIKYYGSRVTNTTVGKINHWGVGHSSGSALNRLGQKKSGDLAVLLLDDRHDWSQWRSEGDTHRPGAIRREGGKKWG